MYVIRFFLPELDAEFELEPELLWWKKGKAHANALAIGSGIGWPTALATAFGLALAIAFALTPDFSVKFTLKMGQNTNFITKSFLLHFEYEKYTFFLEKTIKLHRNRRAEYLFNTLIL